MAEIGVAGPGRENQGVVGQRVAVLEQHALLRRIHAGHRGEQGRDLGTAAQEIADRPGNFRGRQRGGGDLVKQRLEQMVVAAIDQRDADRRAGQAKRRLQPAETGTNDHDAMALCRSGLLGGHVLGLSGSVRSIRYSM